MTPAAFTTMSRSVRRATRSLTAAVSVISTVSVRIGAAGGSLTGRPAAITDAPPSAKLWAMARPLPGARRGGGGGRGPRGRGGGRGGGGGGRGAPGRGRPRGGGAERGAAGQV